VVHKSHVLVGVWLFLIFQYHFRIIWNPKMYITKIIFICMDKLNCQVIKLTMIFFLIYFGSSIPINYLVFGSSGSKCAKTIAGQMIFPPISRSQNKKTISLVPFNQSWQSFKYFLKNKRGLSWKIIYGVGLKMSLTFRQFDFKFLLFIYFPPRARGISPVPWKNKQSYCLISIWPNAWAMISSSFKAWAKTTR